MSVFSRIIDKDRRAIVPRLNIFQVRLCLAYEAALAAGKPARIVALKPRQIGGTTASAAIMVHHANRFPSTQGVFIADILDRSIKLFKMAKKFTELDRFPWGHQWEWTEKQGSNGLGSELEIKTAENPTASRASTLTALHMSELAFWPSGGAKDARETMTALLNSLAQRPNTVALAESTPKGAYGVFPELWQRAAWPASETYWQKWDLPEENETKLREAEWIRVFSAWWEHEEYQGHPGKTLTKDDLTRIEDSLTEREQAGIKLYGWTIPQIAWRRWCIANNCQGSEIKFDEEYPEDPGRCWLASGSPRFHHLGLAFLKRMAALKSYEVGSIDVQAGGRAVWRKDKDGMFWLWELPRAGFRYLISLDTAEDEDASPSPDHADRDRHSALVWRAARHDDKTGFYRTKLVARLRPPFRGSLANLMELVDALSRLYGRCILVPEINRNAAFVIHEAKRLGIPIYRTKTLDPVSDRMVERYGYLTTEASRAEAIERLALGIREAQTLDTEEPSLDALEIYCPHLIEEAHAFIIDKKGKAKAAPGKHDDDIMAAAIGIACLGGATEYMPDEKTGRVVVHDLTSGLGKTAKQLMPRVRW
jgi:hypothetical protein